MNERGNGTIRLLPSAKIIVLPTCSYCGALVSVCRCGEPKRRPAA